MPPNPRPAIERLLPRLQFADSGCWQWTGALNKFGYGKISVGGRDGRILGTHRVAYEALIGPIPDGMQLDHLCRNRACCNPAHLEVVTPRINTLRGDSAAAANSVKEACGNGHEFTPANTYVWRGQRHCRTCRREADRRRNRAEYARIWRARKKTA